MNRAQARALTAHLTSILESLNLDTFIDLVNELEAGTDQRDLIDRLAAQLTSIANVQNAVPCLVELAGVLDNIHAQLVTIPADFRTIDEVLNEVNVTLTEALEQVNNFRDDLVRFSRAGCGSTCALQPSFHVALPLIPLLDLTRTLSRRPVGSESLSFLGPA